MAILVWVLEDPWLPRPITFQIYDEPPIPDHLYVIDLKKANGDWDEVFIRVVFNPNDANLMLKILTSEYCRANRDVRQSSGFYGLIQRLGRKDVLAFLMRVSRAWLREKFELFLVLSQDLWYVRNSVANGGHKSPVAKIVGWCYCFLAEYKGSNTDFKRGHPRKKVNW
uniref:Uncharacterized protein n=1 Tax=Cannabis sativa TaxID=3483 RepID=A0A803QP13_CANSA